MKPTDQEILHFWNGPAKDANRKKIIAFGLRMFELGISVGKDNRTAERKFNPPIVVGDCNQPAGYAERKEKSHDH